MELKGIPLIHLTNEGVEVPSSLDLSVFYSQW